MQFHVPIHIKKLEPPINYRNKILLIGSCFTEHIGDHLVDHKFKVFQNPNGILFDPLSVCRSLHSYIRNKQYAVEDLFELNEAWHSWEHHSRFSGMNKEEVVAKINASQNAAHAFLKDTDHLIITLGSSFVYRLENERAVANCHKAPAQQFAKYMLAINETVDELQNILNELKQFNHKLKLIFTISPVRHIRDGVVENNRSKARLTEAVHQLVDKNDHVYYFPAYEIVIDVLRDYRFYDIDLVHPNFAATSYVLEQFTMYCLDDEAKQIKEEIHKILIARNHKPFNPTSSQHKAFLKMFYEKTKALQEKYSFLDLEEELSFFSS